MLLQTNLFGNFSIDPRLAIDNTTMSVGGSFNDGNVLYTNSEIPVHAPYQVSNEHIPP